MNRSRKTETLGKARDCGDIKTTTSLNFFYCLFEKPTKTCSRARHLGLTGTGNEAALMKTEE